MSSLDRASLQLLQALQDDARQTVQELARQVGLSSTPCWKRIKDMEAGGVIRGYTVVVDREKVGLGLQVMVEVNLDRRSASLVQEFEDQVRACPSIVHCLSTTGQADFVLTVLTQDIKSYERLLQSVLVRLPGVTHLRSSIVLREVKPLSHLPLQF
ncbi:Lrp/AsnC family transcriptional regulator [Amphibiibacter pelophylacis]|uniref:Lrp/AsnC family transcriptional regulator n=1 Tax=Amphibiibacter pelophylacis TaxID=1799477 RepID=A0ACC6P018_9BURK